MKKRKLYWLLWISVVAITFIVGSTVVYAAMTYRDEKVNLFQVGNLETKIDEVFTKPSNLTPGSTVEKKVKVKNSGTIDQFVRVMVHPVISSTSENGEVRILPCSIGNEVILEGLDSTSWKFDSVTGYYYYLKKIPPQSESSELFTKVNLKSGLGSEYDQTNLSISIKVEAITSTESSLLTAWSLSDNEILSILKSTI